jgi:hypothetical protein
MRKKLYKNTYILKLLFKVVTARSEALVISGNPVPKKSIASELSHTKTLNRAIQNRMYALQRQCASAHSTHTQALLEHSNWGAV